VAGKDRKKQLARLRYERQVQRRAAKQARARKIKVIGTVVATALVAGGGTALAVGFNPYAKKPPQKAAAKPTPKVTPPPPKPRVQVKKGECAYQPTNFAQVPQEQLKNVLDATKEVGAPPKQPDRAGDYTETIETNQGTIKIELHADKAPCTVNSFKYLAGRHFFAGSSCHRLITKGIFALQCGDPSGSGMGGPRYGYASEDVPKPDSKEASKPITYSRGTVAMANSGGPESNGSQFFIVYKDSKLPPQYTRFGTVVEGMDVLEKVAKGGTVSEDPQVGGGPPKTKVVIKDITITKN
jgi:peptidyl-prolyl cis-trans isomerase B (cyclophilin B)